MSITWPAPLASLGLLATPACFFASVSANVSHVETQNDEGLGYGVSILVGIFVRASEKTNVNVGIGVNTAETSQEGMGVAGLALGISHEVLDLEPNRRLRVAGDLTLGKGGTDGDESWYPGLAAFGGIEGQLFTRKLTIGNKMGIETERSFSLALGPHYLGTLGNSLQTYGLRLKATITTASSVFW